MAINISWGTTKERRKNELNQLNTALLQTNEQ